MIFIDACRIDSKALTGNAERMVIMKLEDYRTHIDRLIREMSGEIVLNGSHNHATIIIERMFANASKQIRILSRKFDERVFGTPETTYQAESFLGEDGRSVRILIEDYNEQEMARNPFFARMSQFLESERLQIRQVPPALAELISINFSVMDDVGYRFEEDKNFTVAVAAFEPENDMTTKCIGLFDSLWKVSSDIKLPLAV
jgi:hypothetical protein